MDPANAYAPPKSAAADSDPAPENARIPALFKAGLVLFVLMGVLLVLAGASLIGGVVGTGLVVIAAWRTLAGSRAAARVLACLLVLNGLVFGLGLAAMLLGDPARTTDRLAGTVFVAVQVLLSFSLAAYTVFGADMRAVHRRTERDKWRGG